MPYTLITTHRKDLFHPPGHGYGRNIGTAAKPDWVVGRGRPVSKWVIHATHGNKGTLSANEAKFLRDSPNVSAQNLVGKSGEVYQLLPDDMLAWHAGVARAGWALESVGTEIHHAIGESYSNYQFETLTMMGRDYIKAYGLQPGDIETHRAIALPKGRKSDPADWSDAAFYAWRASLFVSAEPDWAALWSRPNYADVKDFGIPSAWRDAHLAGKPWGKALTDEMPFLNGSSQLFERVVVSWIDGTLKVYRAE